MAEEPVQRRLAAIMAADVVGYSRLMEADEVGTLADLKTRRKEVLQPLVANTGVASSRSPVTVCSLSSEVQSTPCNAQSNCSAEWLRRMEISPKIAMSCCVSGSIWAMS